MIAELPHILAQDGDDIAKIIFGVFFAVIWALSALASWVNKKQQEAKRQRMREQMARMPAPPAPPAPPPMPRRIAEGLAQRHPEVLRPPPVPPMPVPLPPQWPPQQQPRPVPPPRMPDPPRASAAASKRQRAAAQKAAQQAAQRAADLRAIEEDEQRRRAAQSRRAPQVTAPPLPRQPGGADARGIRAWMTPEKLRSQFILTEILQPPVAMRQGHLAD